MKSSVRILAIALALAFLLLARTAFQEDTTASAADEIDLKDGEASFADPLNGLNEAEYLGLAGGATTTVYFYIESEDLGTQVTARTTNSDISTPASTLTETSQVADLRGGNAGASQVDDYQRLRRHSGQTRNFANHLALSAIDLTAVRTALDTAYCAEDKLIYVSYSATTRTLLPSPDNATTSISPCPAGAWLALHRGRRVTQQAVVLRLMTE